MVLFVSLSRMVRSPIGGITSSVATACSTQIEGAVPVVTVRSALTNGAWMSAYVIGLDSYQLADEGTGILGGCCSGYLKIVAQQ